MTPPTRPGAPFLEHPLAPTWENHRPSKPLAEIETLLREKAKLKAKSVAAEKGRLESLNQKVDEFSLTLWYDTLQAPRTTNASQLESFGIPVPTKGKFPASDEACHQALWTIIYGLAMHGIFLVHTDHLSDKALLMYLCTQVLTDEITDVPPSSTMSEYLDLGSQFAEMVTLRDQVLPRAALSEGHAAAFTPFEDS